MGRKARRPQKPVSFSAKPSAEPPRRAQIGGKMILQAIKNHSATQNAGLSESCKRGEVSCCLATVRDDSVLQGRDGESTQPLSSQQGAPNLNRIKTKMVVP